MESSWTKKVANMMVNLKAFVICDSPTIFGAGIASIVTDFRCKPGHGALIPKSKIIWKVFLSYSPLQRRRFKNISFPDRAAQPSG